MVILDNGYYVDENNNFWNAERYTLEEAQKHSENLINCHDCVDCEYCKDCMYCVDCQNCVECEECFKCDYCINCYNIVDKANKTNAFTF